MTIDEALMWLDPDKRDPKIDEYLENANGIDAVDIVIGKFNEACRTVVREIEYLQQLKEWVKEEQ